MFGHIAEDDCYEVLDRMNNALTDENDEPYENIRILHVVILDDPFDDFADEEGMKIFAFCTWSYWTTPSTIWTKKVPSARRFRLAGPFFKKVPSGAGYFFLD